MYAVWKFDLTINDNDFTRISMPVGAEIIHVGIDPATPNDQSALRLWAIVDRSHRETEERLFLVRGTGHTFANGANITSKHLGSVIAPPFAWHVFEIK